MGLIRVDKLGHKWLSRPDAEIESKMDADPDWLRTHPDELKWVPRTDYMDHVNALNGTMENVTAYIFGKGKSLDKFWLDEFHGSAVPRKHKRGEDGIIVVALNEAVQTCVQHVFVDFHFCLDLGSAKKGTPPGTHAVTLDTHSRPVANGQLLLSGGSKVYVLGTKHSIYGGGSGTCALQVLSDWGIKDFVMIGHDGLDGDPSYSETVERTTLQRKTGFAGWRFFKEIISERGLNVTWYHRMIASNVED